MKFKVLTALFLAQSASAADFQLGLTDSVAKLDMTRDWEQSFFGVQVAAAYQRREALQPLAGVTIGIKNTFHGIPVVRQSTLGFAQNAKGQGGMYGSGRVALDFSEFFIGTEMNYFVSQHSELNRFCVTPVTGSILF